MTPASEKRAMTAHPYGYFAIGATVYLSREECETIAAQGCDSDTSGPGTIIDGPFSVARGEHGTYWLIRWEGAPTTQYVFESSLSDRPTFIETEVTP